jgi:putative aldouronate transport system permease protein
MECNILSFHESITNINKSKYSALRALKSALYNLTERMTGAVCMSLKAETSTGYARRPSAGRTFRKYLPLYIMLVPALIYLVIFKAVPLLGSSLAFMNYNVYTGFSGASWAGLKWFIQFFTYDQFRRILVNTVEISLLQLVFAFPAPIILACLLNEVRKMYFKRPVQTVVYLPHFISWSIVYGICYMLFSSSGTLNGFLGDLGMPKVNVLSNPKTFKALIVITGIWKEMGWSSIIFLAAITGISPELYEAARIDGAGRWQSFRFITLPGITPAIVTMLLISVAYIMDVGFEQIYIFLTPLTNKVGDVLDTFTFIHGIQRGEYSIATAVGLFKSAIGLAMILIANRASKAITGDSLF